MPDQVDTNGARPQLSVVIPTYGAQRTLPILVDRLCSVLKDRSFEIILVHDCGPDGSWSTIGELAKRHQNVRGINLRKNFGQHNAVMAGLSYANGAAIVTMDDDLQHAPEDIPALCDKLSEGYDVCYAKFASRKHAYWKRFGSYINDLIARFLLNKPKGLYLSPFRCFTRAIRDELVKFSGPSVYIDGLILGVTRNISTVYVSHHNRADGEGNYTLRRSVRLLLHMSTSGSIAPLRLAAVLGLTMSFTGFIATILFIVQKFTVDAMPIGWSSLIVTSLILGGAQLFALGILGEYVGQLYLRVNARPQYVIADTINIETSGETA